MVPVTKSVPVLGTTINHKNRLRKESKGNRGRGANETRTDLIEVGREGGSEGRR